jgi:hypothetical protein
VLLKLAYLSVSSVFAMLRLLPMSDRDKDVEILALRHQIAVLERQLGGQRIQFDPGDRVFLAALLHHLPNQALRRMRLLVRPDTVLRWHRGGCQVVCVRWGMTSYGRAPAGVTFGDLA